MPDVHFHPVYAWNLIDDLYEDGLVQEPSTFARSELGRGRAEGWIRPELKQRARMFAVFADSVVVPGLVDGVDLSALHADGHLKARHEIVKLGPRYGPRHRPEGLTPILDKLIASHGEGVIEDKEIQALLAWWQELHDYEALVSVKVPPEVWDMIDGLGLREAIAKGKPDESPMWYGLSDKNRGAFLRLFRDDPLRDASRFQRSEKLVEREYLTLADAAQLAAEGVPTLANQRVHATVPDADTKSEVDATDAIVSLYFANVAMPVPDSARDALTMREHPSVLEWRTQISRWSMDIQDARLDLRSVRQQMDEATAYIEGARFLTRTLSAFSSTVCVPLGLVAGAAGQMGMPVGTVISGGLFAIEGLKMYGELVRRAVESPDRLQYKWLMLSGN